MLRPLLVLVFVLKHVFAERVRPSPDPMYKPPVTQDIFRVTNGTPGVSSVAKMPLLGRLGTRQTSTCTNGTIEVCKGSAFPCCDASFPVCCPSSSICCSSASHCVNTTTGATLCCPSDGLACPRGCCPGGTTCCDQYCCTVDYDCEPDTTGALGCVFRWVRSTSESTSYSRSAAGSGTDEIASTSSANAEQMEQDAKKKYNTMIGAAAGVSIGTVALVVVLSLGFWLYKRRKRQAAQGVPIDQNPTTPQTDQNPNTAQINRSTVATLEAAAERYEESYALPQTPPIHPNALGLSQ